mgnify:FL=1
MTELQLSVFDFMRLASLLAVLIISNIFFSRWEPKIKEQYRATIIIAIGLGAGFLIADSSVLGVIIAGVVMYGVDVSEEINKLKDTVKALDRNIDKKIDTKIKEIEDGEK